MLATPTRSQIELELHEAAERLSIAIARIEVGWRNLQNGQPGFPSAPDGPGAKGAVSDPTPAQALGRRDPARVDLDRLVAASRRALGAATDAWDVTVRWSQKAKLPEPECPEDWCQSCFRDHQHHTPIAVGKYARWCRWCGGFNASYHVVPPVPLVRAHNEGRYVTTKMVGDALAKMRTDAQRPPAKKMARGR